VAITSLALVADLIWLVYLFRSSRVQHVFLSHDWEMAVESIHPLKLKGAT
jgi:hypothetical protein